MDISFYVEHFSNRKEYSGIRDPVFDRDAKLCELTGEEIKPRWVTAEEWEYIIDSYDSDYNYWDRNKVYYRERNYALFEILMNNELTSWKKPRGIPSDASCAYLNQVDMADSDGHSHSYLTLNELLDLDWSKHDKSITTRFLEILEDIKKIDEDTSNIRCLFFFD